MNVRRAFRNARLADRGQSGFVVITSLAVWMLVGGIVMIALLNMTVSVSNQAKLLGESAQRSRAIDGALETAVAQIQTDPSGRIGSPTGKGDGSCEAPLGAEGGALVVDDGFGERATVTATCWDPVEKGGAHRVDLSARLDGDGGAVGSAELAVSDTKGPGNDVAVESWTIGGDPGAVDPSPTTTSTTTTTTSTTTTTTKPTTTSTTTTVPVDPVSTVLTVTSDWGFGYCVNVDVRNNGAASVQWKVSVPAKGVIWVFWNGNYSQSGGRVTVTGFDWNRTLPPGGTTSFGFCSFY